MNLTTLEMPVETALLIVILATSGALDDVATKHTSDSVKGLLDLAPDRAADRRRCHRS